MTKKILSLMFAALLSLTCFVSVFAAPEIDYVIDEQDNLYDDEVEMLNEEAAAIYDNYSVGVFFVFTWEPSSADYNVSTVVGEMEDYVVMVETIIDGEPWWYLHKGGVAAKIIDEESASALRAVYDEASTYRSGVSAFFAACENVFLSANLGDSVDVGDGLTGNTIGAADPVVPSGDKSRLYDGADILSDSEEADLLAKLDRISEEFKVDVAVVSVDGTGEMSTTEYVNYYFEQSELGYGADRDAVLFLIDMDAREFRILSNGQNLGAAAITSGVIESITNSVKPDLSKGYYADAFNEFADECEYQINGFINGFPFKAGRNLLISLIIGIVVALIVTGSMKGKLKSVKKQTAANNYVKEGSLAIYDSRDIFLYSHVTSRKKSDDSSSKSSSGGSSRNVGGGSF